MSNHNQFVRQTAVVLLSIGLIAGLLPGFGFAQEPPRNTTSDNHSAKTQGSSAPTAGLIGWWKLDETPGTSVPDSSGQGKHGVRVNNPAYRPGKFGDCLYFDNTSTTADNAHVIIDSYPEVNRAIKSGKWTFSCWARPDRTVDKMGECLVFCDYQGVSWSHDSGFVSAYYISNDDTRWSRGAVHPTGQWYHVCGVVDTTQGTNQIYVDGKLEATVKFPVGKTTGRGHDRLLFAVSDPDPEKKVDWRREAFKGSIDQVRVYNRPLSAAEAQALANESPAGAVFGADATGGGVGAGNRATPDAPKGDPAMGDSASAAAENSAFRTWTDASGKHQVVARQLAVDDNWVLLETKDGKRIRVPISKLSSADQAIFKGQAAHWPQFRGPNRDGKSPETGLLRQWTEAGPSLVRTISGVGGGFSSPVIAGERIYITGKVGDDLKIFCFDVLGKKLWERTHAPAFGEANAPHSPYPGARATPTIDGDMIYLLGGLGRLTAYRTSNGDPVWSVDIVGELGGRVPPWGYAESVLIDGDKLICTPGGEKTGTFAALDKKTGRVLWQSKEVTQRAEYASAILVEYNNVRQVVTMTRGGLVAVSPENGKLIWRYNRFASMGTPETTTAHCNSPAYADGHVFEATSYHTRGGSTVALKPTATGLEAELAWESRGLNCEHGGYVIVDGYVYMNQGVGWSCLELKTGRQRWAGRGPGKGSIIYADGMLYCLGEKGKMGLLEASPEGFKLVSMFDLPRGEGPCWTHPVIAGGKLYLRWADNLYVYDIKE